MKRSLPIYGTSIAPTGQAGTHAPQSIHVSGSIEYLSPSLIASTGHSGLHAPQAIHSSLIVCAILSPSIPSDRSLIFNTTFERLYPLLQ